MPAAELEHAALRESDAPVRVRTFSDLLALLLGRRGPTRQNADLLAPGLNQKFHFCWHCCREVDHLEVLANEWRDQISLLIACHGERLRTEIDVARLFLHDDYDLSYVRAFDFRTYRYERFAAFWAAVEYSALEPLIT